MDRKKIERQIIATFFILLVVLITFFITKYLLKDSINILNDDLISWGVGWQNHSTIYSGSELRFVIRKTHKISVKVNVPTPEPNQEIELVVENKYYYLSSPDLNKKELTIYLDQKSFYIPQEIKIRVFCTYESHPCKISINSINVDSSVKLFKSQALPSNTLAILGDSISSNFGSKNYTLLLADKLNYQLHNTSIFESTITKNKNKRDAIGRFKKDIIKYNPNVVLIFMGVNDALGRKSLEEFIEDYKTIVENLKKDNRTVKIFAVGLLKCRSLDLNTVLSYNSAIKNLALNENINYIDTYNWLDDSDFMDEIHPSLQAQEKLSAKFLEEISKIIK